MPWANCHEHASPQVEATTGFLFKYLLTALSRLGPGTYQWRHDCPSWKGNFPRRSSYSISYITFPKLFDSLKLKVIKGMIEFATCLNNDENYDSMVYNML